MAPKSQQQWIRDLSGEFNESSVGPVFSEEAAFVLHSGLMEVRFERDRFGFFVFPKAPNGTTQEEFWLHTQMTGFEEYLCQTYRPEDGILETCSFRYEVPFTNASVWSASQTGPKQVEYAVPRLGKHENGTYTISAYLVEDEQEQRPLQCPGGATRNLATTPNSLKISFIVSNYTPVSIPESHLDNPLDNEFVELRWGTRMTISHPIRYNPLLGPAVVFSDPERPFHIGFRISPIIEQFYVNFIQANFSVVEPPSVSRYLRPAEEWGFETIDTAYAEESFTDRSFFFTIYAPGGRDVIYDPDLSILLSSPPEDGDTDEDGDGYTDETGSGASPQRNDDDDDDEALVMGLSVSLSLLCFLVVVASVAAFLYYAEHRKRVFSKMKVSNRQSLLVAATAAETSTIHQVEARDLNVGFNLSSIVPVSKEEAAFVLHSERMEVRFEGERFGFFIFPKAENGTTQEQYWFHFQLTGFLEDFCGGFRPDGVLNQCETRDFCLCCSPTPRFGPWRKRPRTRASGGASRNITVDPQSLKISFLVKNYTSIALSPAQLANASASEFFQLTLGTRVTLSHDIKYIPLLGPAELFIDTDRPYHLGMRIRPVIDKFYVQFIQCNFSVVDPPSVSRYVRAEEEWGFEETDFSYDYNSYTNRSFFLEIDIPGGRQVLYDPDISILLSTANEDGAVDEATEDGDGYTDEEGQGKSDGDDDDDGKATYLGIVHFRKSTKLSEMSGSRRQTVNFGN
ncbi:hypothetical protein QOT17_004688 [Balamuthia mandrillaris]